MRSLITAILNRLTALMGAALASRFQARMIIDHANTLAEMEAHARQLEDAGFADLATSLRQQAHEVTLTDPAAAGSPALEQFTAERPAALPNGQPQETDQEPLASPPRRRGRPPKHLNTHDNA